MDSIVVRILLFYLFARPTNLQLLINVRNQGGDVILENITANVSEDTVKLQFLRPDGVFVSQLVDFTNEVEAMKVIIPGEEELSQTGYQVLCFLTHAAQADFIAPDAMVKLRQKNPGTVRVAEEDKGWRQTTATGWVGRSAAQILSPAAARHCSAAAQRGSLYLRVTDIARWPLKPGQEQYRLEVTAFPEHALAADTADGVPAVEPCLTDTDPAKECICHLEVCVNWYPCGLKYCKGKPGGLSYRCGIKTCRRCYRYHYYVLRRDSCAST